MSTMARRKIFSLCAAAFAAAIVPTFAAAASPTVWCRFLSGNIREWFPVPMYGNSVERTVAGFSVGWPNGVKVETCVTYGDQKP